MSEGHEVHVLTARHRDCPNEAVVNGVQVHRVGFDSLKEAIYYYFGGKNPRGRVGASPQKPGWLTRLTGWFYNTFWKNIYFPDDACLWYFPAKKKTKEMLDTGGFDLLITVSLPFTGHLIGLSTVRRTSRSVEMYASTDLDVRRTKTTWVADIGDPFTLQIKSLNNSFLYGKLSRRLERRVLESADAVTVTTEFTLQKYRDEFGDAAVARMYVVPPLLHPVNPTPCPSPTGRGDVEYSREDADDVAARSTSPLPVGEGPGVGLKLGYFGALYAPIRTPDAFLDLLEQTFALRHDLRERLEVHFYGEIFPEFFENLSAQPAIRLHGLRSREEARHAMREMDILLNIGNTTDFQLPSKAVEYLATGKPIVNLSYTDEDPFAAFFIGNALVLNLKVTNGRVGEGEVRRWLEWLEAAKIIPGEAEIRERITPYLVGAIAMRYLLLGNRIP